MRHSRLLAPLAVLGASCAVAVPAAAAGHKHKSKQVVKTVHVGDDYFSPTKVTIRVGQYVRWVWNAANVNSHNVTLVKGPKHVNRHKFTSITGSTQINFKRKFTVAGTYHFICTIHPTMMKMTVVVKR